MRLLATKLHPELSFDNVVRAQFQFCLFAEASMRCLRLISLELGDARKNDWFTMYCDVYGQYVKYLYDALIAQAKGQVYVGDVLARGYKLVVDQARDNVMKGLNWNSNKGATGRDSPADS